MDEIARAVLHDAKVIIFDEPTATLTPEEKQHFFKLIKDLKSKGVGVVFIPTRWKKPLSMPIASQFYAMTSISRRMRPEISVQAIVGRELSGKLYSRHSGTTRLSRGKKILSIENLSMQNIVKNNSFSIYTGQITGIFGLIGSGRTETAEIISGVVKRDFFHGGEVYLEGKPIRYNAPQQTMRDGIAYVTEDRKFEGFFETMSIANNIYMGHLAASGPGEAFLSAKRHGSITRKWIKMLKFKALNADARVVELSGGNQQKVVIGKSLCQNPKLIFFDEPTRGVDVGAIQEIHVQLNALADQGLAVVVISSYLPEILNLSDNILVARQGKIIEEFRIDEVTDGKTMYAAVH